MTVDFDVFGQKGKSRFLGDRIRIDNRQLTPIESARKMLRENGLRYVKPTNYSLQRLQLAQIDCQAELCDDSSHKDALMRIVNRLRYACN